MPTPTRPDGFCHRCHDRPGERFAVAKVIGVIEVPYPARVWFASYSPTGKLCKPCAVQEAREKNQGR